MAKTTIQVELSAAQEIALLNRYGRRCSPETLVKRAIDEVLKQQADDIPIFVSRADYLARVKAELGDEERAEVARLAAIPPAALALFERFQAGEKMRDEEGREISALALTTDDPEPLIAQFGSDNSEWYPVGPGEIRVDLPQSTPENGESKKSNA